MRPTWRRIALVFLVVFGLVVVEPARPADVAARTGSHLLLPLAERLPGPSSYWGVQSCCAGDVIRDPSVATQVRRSGAGWTRLAIQWSLVEPAKTTPDRFDWSYFDSLILQVTNTDRLKPVVILESAPSWATDSYLGQGPLRPGMLPEWLQFVEATVARYSKPPYDVHYWELYNEPDGRSDVPHYVGRWGNDPTGFVALMKATYPTIKRVDPEARVVISPAYEWFSDVYSDGLFVHDWLDRVLDPARGNAGDSFDLFGLHMYTYFRPLWDPYGRDIIGKARYLRALMARYGVAKPMIVTEMGEAAGAPWGDPDVQARYLIKGTVRALAADNRLVIWFSLVDFDDWKRGLLDTSFRPRPDVAAARRMNDELPDPTFVGEITTRLSVASDVEGYYFASPLGETLLIWVDKEDDPAASRTILLPASVVRTMDRLGNERWIADADDGRTDRTVTLRVTREPLFVRVMRTA